MRRSRNAIVEWPAWLAAAAAGFVWAFLGFSQAAPAGGGEAPAKGQWVNISDGVLAKLAEQNVKPAWPGKTAGLSVDRTTGALSMIVAGLGVWRSADKGAAFERVEGKVVGGRCETGYSLCADPAGKRLACFMLDGKSGMTADGGKTWAPIKNINRGYDWGAVDWSQETVRTMFVLVHESGGIGAVSQDAGKTWKQIGKGYFAVGVFSQDVLVCGKEKQKGIWRSSDAGETWQKVAEAAPVGAMTVLGGAGWWLSDAGLLASKDQGKTWSVVAEASDAAWGPYFYKDAAHFVVVDKKGFQETTDGGKTFKLIAPYPPGLKGEHNKRGWMMNFAWDPVGKVCYVSRMGQPAWKCEY